MKRVIAARRPGAPGGRVRRIDRWFRHPGSRHGVLPGARCLRPVAVALQKLDATSSVDQFKAAVDTAKTNRPGLVPLASNTRPTQSTAP
jgi:hypothetical protein